jgi:transposase InsO family protein
VTAVQSAQTVLEEWLESLIVVNLMWNWVACCWWAHIRVVKGIRRENENHLSEIAVIVMNTFPRPLGTCSHRDIVLVDLWNRSPTCRVVSPVIHVYRKMATCSSSKTALVFVWPSLRSCARSLVKTWRRTPSSQWIRSGCPAISSNSHPSPVRTDIW